MASSSLSHTLRLTKFRAVSVAVGLVCLGAFPGSGYPAKPASMAMLARDKHLAGLGVDHAGVTGKGVKIAILDTGFRGYHDHLGHALPAHVVAHSFRADHNLEARDSQHGILCAEVIHAIAPDAELLLADWDLERPDEFLAAVRWAREQGAKVISCSVVAPAWSDGEGGGDVHRELDGLVGSGNDSRDLLCFASAGNTIDRHWSGAFKNGGDNYHEWAPGKTDNPLRPWNSETVAVHLYSKPGAGYELTVLEADSDRVVRTARTDDSQTDRLAAVVRFLPESGHLYRVRVRQLHGPEGNFHLTSMFASIEYRAQGASVCFPADGAHVVAMGAVDENGQRQWYSACGPNSKCPKPDLVATVPFPSLWREKPFGGTSAAAPQGAALAALWWSRHPDWNADQIRKAMRDAARDLLTPGYDCETGFGLIQLPKTGF